MLAGVLNITIRKFGGALGSKISQLSHVAAVCAVAANKLRLHIRMGQKKKHPIQEIVKWDVMRLQLLGKIKLKKSVFQSR